MNWSPCGLAFGRRVVWAVRAIAVVILILATAHEAKAATVTVTWSPNAEPNIAGYIVSYGTQSGVYPNVVDVGNVTTWQVNLAGGQRYFFVLQAYNTNALVSARCPEVFADITGAAGPAIVSLTPSSGSAGTPVTINGTSFGTTQGTSIVRFNGTAATPTSWNATSIGVPVPNGATTGPVVVTVNGLASNGMNFTVGAPSNLPAPWTTQDIGNPALAGQATFASGTFSVSGGGVDIWDTSDQFRFVFQPLSGNGEIVARVGSLQTADQWTKAGVMIREDLTSNAPNVIAEVTAGNGMVFQRRDTRGGLSASIKGFAGVAPQWVRVVRSGNTFSGYYSVNGTAWTLMGTSTVSMATQAFVGLALTSHNPSVASNATFTNVAVTTGSQNQAPTLTQPANQTSAEGTTPSLQLVASDPNGNPLTYSATGLPASLSVSPTTGLISGTLTFTSAGTYTVTATASDGALSNSKTFTWTVTDVSQAGPTISSLLPSSGAVGTPVTITGANFGTTQGTSSIRFNGTVATPTSWTATSIVAPVPTGTATGAVVVTVNGVSSNGVTFTVNAPGTLPVPWQTQDVGSPALAGQATFASGTFSVTGAGADIWYTPDQFRFVYQTLVGDGEIVARVGSLGNTDPWSKAGVMIREDLQSNAPDVLAAVTPGNGTVFQKRMVRGQNTNTTTTGIPGVAPQWVRLVRSGNTFSGYVSTNGTAWTLMGSGTVTMASQVFVGLALTSHNASVIANATFTNVTVNGVATNSIPAPAVISSSATPGAAPLASSNQAIAGKAVVKALPVSRPTLNDYDGDGRADIATYRQSTGEWRIRTSGSNYATGLVTRWGTAMDLPVPGDYDGDRRTDLAYYRPSTGTWSILESSSNYTTSFDVWLGADGDVPVPGDYDGDGVTDVAVYSPATGQWRILKSTTGYTTEIVSLWGAATDIPVPGDYDGDGKTDLAVYRPSTGAWRIRLSSTDYTTDMTLVLGSGADIPVQADYDGDGVTDAAVFQPSSGTWLTLPSSNKVKTVLAILGAGSDVPVPGDYDGDGRADVAVFHAGIWQVLPSSVSGSSGVRIPLRGATDVAVPGRP